MTPPTFPGAVAPERTRRFTSNGVSLCLREWGDPAAAPVVLTHGMFDHGRGFDLLAPLLAERFRVIAIDARGHGDSDWVDAYTWWSDLIDILHVLQSLGRPAHLIGHSRGGGQATDAATRAPELVRQLVDMDGFGPPPEGFRAFGEDGFRSPPEQLAGFLDWRRRSARHRERRAYATLDELAESRRRQNPRLSLEWLRYFQYHGARETERGWTLKVDPHAGRGVGPWNPDWIAPSWRSLRAPMLALIGSEPDTWGPLPEEILAARLAHVPRLQRGVVAGAGHFMHIEQPERTAALVLDFLEP
jgi:pimeloyl-ACP methyl ester carboxylesterase